MHDFKECNPRTPHYAEPKEEMDGSLIEQYNKLASRCAFPSCYQNGLFHFVFGVFSALAGAACSLSKFFTAGVGYAFNPFVLGFGIAIAAIASYVLWHFLQIKYFMPHNLCFYANDESPQWIRIIVPVVAFVAVVVFCFVDGTDYSIIAAISSGYAFVALFTFYKTGRTGLFTLALLVFVVPTALSRFGMLPFPDLLGNAGLTMLINGAIFTSCGTIFRQAAINGFRLGAQYGQLYDYLTSGDTRKKFLASSNLCTRLDPRVLGALLDIVYDEEPIVAYLAQVAVSNAWGPDITRSLYNPVANMSFTVSKVTARDQEENDKLERRWLKHFTLVEANMQALVNESKHGLENLIRMAFGDVIYKPAQHIALELLGSTQQPEAYAALMRCLLVTDHEVVRSATIGFYGAGLEVIPYLEKFYAAPRAWIRRRAIYATRMLLSYLRRFKNTYVSTAYEMLYDDIENLMQADDTGTFAAAIQLLPVETDDEIGVIEAYCANERQLICIEAMDALVEPHPDIATRWIFDALYDESPIVRYAAVKLCMKLGTKEASFEVCKIVDGEKDPMVIDVTNKAVTYFQDKFFQSQSFGYYGH